MKNAIKINDDVLSLIWGGCELHPELEYGNSIIDNRYGHGKTQPGNNEDIFRRDNL